MKQKTFMQLYKKMSSTLTKDPQQIHSAGEDVNTVDKNTNEDDTWCMVSHVTNVASSTILKTYAEVPGAAQSIPYKRNLYINKSLALKW